MADAGSRFGAARTNDAPAECRASTDRRAAAMGTAPGLKLIRAGLGAIALLFGFAPLAHGEERLVGNLGQTTNGVALGVNEYRAQPFTTGSNTRGYEVERVNIDVSIAGAMNLRLLDAPATGAPGRGLSPTICQLRPPGGDNEVSIGVKSYRPHTAAELLVAQTNNSDITYCTYPLKLDGSTTRYFLVARGPQSNDAASVATTTFPAEDSASFGWTIENERYSRTGGSWDDDADDSSTAKIEIEGDIANEAPTASNLEATLTENGKFTFTDSSFGYDDDDDDELNHVEIVTLPSRGTLALSDTAVTADQEVLKAELGTLTYTPPADTSGASFTTFDFKVNDGMEDSSVQYTVTFNVTSDNADLQTLALSDNVTLSPVFAAATLSYLADVANDVATLTVTPTTANQFAAVTVNDVVVTSGSASEAIALTEGGDTTITVAVTAESETSQSYVITVRRAASANANLSALALSAGTLDPAFAAGTLSYDVDVANDVATLTVTPTTDHGNATVTVDGGDVTSGIASDPIALAADSTITITVVVTAQNGTTQSYVITVTRLSGNADLASLILSDDVMLVPEFAADTLNYAVATDKATLTVTPTTGHGEATVTVDGDDVTSGSASDSIALAADSTTTITVVVTAQNGTPKSYSIAVARGTAVSNSTDLSALVLSAGTLTPEFAADTVSYTANVAGNVATLTVMPTTDHLGATVTVNGDDVRSGSASGPIALTANNTTTITVAVTAQDGTTLKSYDITVARAASDNADLSGLALSDGELDPVFAAAITSYAASVASDVATLTVTPTAVVGATVTVNNGAAVASGSASEAIALAEGGVTTVTVEVTAQDGTTRKSYDIAVTRAALPSARFSAAAYEVAEGGIAATITVILDHATDRTLTIPVRVTAVTAEAGDYEVGGLGPSMAPGVAGTLTFGPNEGTTKTFTITAVDEDPAKQDFDDETVLLSFGDHARADGSGATATLTIVDDEGAAAEVRFQRLNNEILSKHALTIADVTIAAVASRQEAGPGCAGQAATGSLGGSSSLGEVVRANAQSLDEGSFNLKRLLGASSFRLQLTEDGSGSGPGCMTFWGQGDYRNLSGGDSRGLDWDGDLVTGQVGADTLLHPDLRAGLAVSWSEGDFRLYGPDRPASRPAGPTTAG